MAIHIGIGNFSGAIAANIYRAQDSPRFIIGRKHNHPLIPLVVIFNFLLIDGVELMFVGIGFIATPAVVLLYIRINKQRNAAQREALENGEKNKYTDKQLREMGDRAPDFRYTL
jgi:hypothetical protein